MEPTLKDGDVLLVRKSDIFANYGFTQSKDEADRARIKRIEATMNANPDHPIMSTPPLVLPGNIVVFLSPHTAFPHEYRVKRVIGVGGQMVLPHSRFHNIESVPPYSVWVEGDNKNYSEDSVNHGPISKKLLVGQAARIIWPPSRWSKLTRMSLSEGKAWWS